jgi:hypothetical protein
VDEDGAVTSIALTHGGVYNGEDGSGDYNLDAAESTLFMMAKNQQQETASTIPDLFVGVSIGSGAAVVAFLVGIVFTRRRAESVAAAAATPSASSADGSVLSATNNVPPMSTDLL